MCPFCFLSLSQVKDLGMTVEMDPTGGTITFPAFGLYSSPAEHSTMGHIVLDLTSPAYQPSRVSNMVTRGDMLPLPCQSEDQHIQLMHQTWMKMKMRMINYLCGQHHGRNLQKKIVIQIRMGDLVSLVSPRPPPAAPVRKRKGPPAWQDPAATLEHEVPKDSRERAEDTSIGAEKQKVKPYPTF